jgi:hypothetical protein
MLIGTALQADTLTFTCNPWSLGVTAVPLDSRLCGKDWNERERTVLPVKAPVLLIAFDSESGDG